MTDSLTASKKWCQYDDDFRQKHGHRLPADPYWLAPPQGSIIPIWHRGGAPNYQPKPMISKHVQDPIKAWNREKHRWPVSSIPTLLRNETYVSSTQELPIAQRNTTSHDKAGLMKKRANSDIVSNKAVEITLIPPDTSKKSVAMYFSSAGTIAEKLSIKLHKWVKSLASTTPNITLKPQIRPLNHLKISNFKPSKVLLLVISSTGRGEIPTNGASVADMCKAMLTETYIKPKREFYFAIFGNGDSRYSSTFNGAALQVNQMLKQIGGVSIAGGLFKGDTAVEPLPLRALKVWYTKLEAYFTSGASSKEDRPSPVAFNKFEKLPCVTVSVTSIQDGDDNSPVDDALPALDEYQQQVLSTLREAAMTVVTPQILGSDQRSRILSLDIAGEALEEMACVQVLPVNSRAKVEKVLLALQIKGPAKIGTNFQRGIMDFSHFLREFVDLESTFSTLDWLTSLDHAGAKDLNQDVLSDSSVLKVLQQLSENGVLTRGRINDGLRLKILLAMPLLRLRTYSMASSQHYTQQYSPEATGDFRTIDIMVKTLPSGRFSSTFIQDSPLPATLRYRIVDSVCGPQIRKNYLAPFVIVATGAGFGPVRCLLQWRIAMAREAIRAGESLPSFDSSISLFLGFKKCDLDLVMAVVEEAKALFLVDVVEIVVSNPQKTRAYDRIGDYAAEMKEKLLEREGLAFVCTNGAAAEGARDVFREVLGGLAKELLGERYIEEIF